MRKAWIFMSILVILGSTELFAQQDCITRKELKDKHVVTYQAYNGTIRGCIVSPNFYTQQHKQGRGNLSRTFVIDICEGEPRTSPRVGNSFEICKYHYKPQ